MPSQESIPKYRITDIVRFNVDEDGYFIAHEGIITSVNIKPANTTYSISTTNTPVSIEYVLIPESDIIDKSSNVPPPHRN